MSKPLLGVILLHLKGGLRVPSIKEKISYSRGLSSTQMKKIVQIPR